jgi:hypothetical protein
LGFLDKVKQSAEQAAAKAKEGVSDVQAKRELAQAYGELGKIAYELAEAGELSDERLAPLVERIRALHGQVEAEGSDAEPAPSQPPAMPS